jgi:hypothetical protein
MPNNPRITRVPWNPRMSSKRLNELLATPNIHEDDEDAIMGELWLRDSSPCLDKDKHGIPNHLFYGTPGELCTVCGEKHPFFLDYSPQQHEAMGGR